MKTSIIGLMSGTSLDGLDIAYCTFEQTPDLSWHYQIICAETIDYSETWKSRLSNLDAASALTFAKTDADLAYYFGTEVNKFIQKNNIKPQAIASHGQTIFHQPGNGFTTQIGNGAYIHAITGIPVISDFRTVDVGLGGNGAPLVPVGDELLFHEFDYCLNLGGFANISFTKDHQRIAFDICAVNMVLNRLCAVLDLPYDDNGNIARNHGPDSELLKALSDLSFYKQPAPKSLGKEWVEAEVMPILDRFTLSTEIKIATFTEHVAQQISYILHSNFSLFHTQKMLVTGGGAFNGYLIERIHKFAKGNIEIIVPEAELVMFKEALIFAFLGLLRINGGVNSLCKVTGASKDSIGGAVYGWLEV
jgi:anhydro-N-acetylmuramic acid kinase